MKCLFVRVVRFVVPALGMLFLLVAPLRAQDAPTLFKSKCAACHGADGSGNTPAGKAMKARDFASPEVQNETDEQLIEIVTNGKNKMPSYKGKLTDDQIKGLVAYIRGLAKK
jgi:mono/diheme cytochrome c family protein